MTGQCKEHGTTYALKTGTPYGWGRGGELLSVKFEGSGCRVCDPDWLVGKEHGEIQEPQSSAFCFQLVWGPCACAQSEVTLPDLGRGLGSSRRTQSCGADCSVYPLRRNQDSAPWLHYCFFFFFLCLFRAAPVAYGGSQVRGQIRATAAGLYHSHSNPRSEPHLGPTPQLMATPDP